MKISKRQLQKLIKETLADQGTVVSFAQSMIAAAERAAKAANELNDIERRFPHAVETYMDDNPPEDDSLEEFAAWWEANTFYVEGGELWVEPYMNDPARWDPLNMVWVDDNDPELEDYD